MVHYRHPKVVKVKSKKMLEKPERLSRWKYGIKKFFEFCKRTDLHGFKYIAMEDLSAAERTVWAAAVVISLICAAWLVISAFKWYARNPIITVIESTQGSIWDIPFPAVTICDLNIISRKAAMAFSANLSLPENVTSEFVFKTLKFAPLLHSMAIVEKMEKKNLYILQDILDFNNISVESLFRQLSPAASCGKLIERCMWKNSMYRCEQLFHHIFTGLSLCCTFNFYALNNTKDELYRFPTPRRVASCGYQTALTAIIKTDIEDYYSTGFASCGSLVFIDNAYNIPDLDSPVRMINPGSEVMIAVSPEITYATIGIKNFSPHERQCYFNDEVKLANFHKYSFHNCMALKKTQILINECNCTPFFLPQKDHYRSCNFRDIECLEDIISLNPNKSKIKKYNVTTEPNIKLIECMPECDHFDYPLEVAMGKLNNNVPVSGSSFFDSVDLENRSVLNVFFNDLVATRYRRDAYFNWQNLLSAFGGLLSLMMGFTLISGFDFIVFFSLRVLYDSMSRFFINRSNEPKSFDMNLEDHKHEYYVNQATRNRYDQHVKIRY